MQKLFNEAIPITEGAFRKLERQVTPPQLAPLGDGFVYRYLEKSVEQALIQKLARMISGLHAARLLLDHGFVQEQGVMQRTLDELGEDITFLAASLTNDKITELHKRYLKSFYEEIDIDYQSVSSKKPEVPRKKIHAYVARVLGLDLNESRAIALSKWISKFYSGFIHAASPNIMDMYGGNPPKFHIAGMLGTPHVDEYRKDFQFYLYRGLLDVCLVAKAFGDKPLADSLTSYIEKVEQDNPEFFPSEQIMDKFINKKKNRTA
jgi:hypothetical protein